MAGGITGVRIEDAALDYKLDDFTTTDVMYIGKAVCGAATNSAQWRIKKIDFTAGIVITWADGNTNFDNVWNNRASLTYI